MNSLLLDDYSDSDDSFSPPSTPRPTTTIILNDSPKVTPLAILNPTFLKPIPKLDHSILNGLAQSLPLSAINMQSTQSVTCVTNPTSIINEEMEFTTANFVPDLVTTQTNSSLANFFDNIVEDRDNIQTPPNATTTSAELFDSFDILNQYGPRLPDQQAKNDVSQDISYPINKKSRPNWKKKDHDAMQFVCINQADLTAKTAYEQLQYELQTKRFQNKPTAINTSNTAIHPNIDTKHKFAKANHITTLLGKGTGTLQQRNYQRELKILTDNLHKD